MGKASSPKGESVRAPEVLVGSVAPCGRLWRSFRLPYAFGKSWRHNGRQKLLWCWKKSYSLASHYTLAGGKQDWAGRHFQSFSPFLALQEPLHRRIQTMHREGGRQAEHLFQTLLHRAFSETDSPTGKVEAVLSKVPDEPQRRIRGCQRMMLNAAGRRSGERGYRECENYTYNCQITFHKVSARL